MFFATALFSKDKGLVLLFASILISNIVLADNSEADTSKRIPLFGNFAYQPENSLQVNTRQFRAGLLYDVDNKKIVWEKQMNSVYPIASLTKMMVALLAVEDIHAGKYTWNDKVEWTRDLLMGKGRHRYHSPGAASYTLHDLFKAAMIASNNEAADQMARYIGNGDLDVTIQRMNERARELGMNSTYYGNPTGLPASKKIYDNSSCPTDLLLLCIEMLKYNEITEVTGMDYANIINNGRNSSTIRNHNHLAIDYNGEVDGMKTGYTKRAGFCLVATANKCNHRLVSIVLGAPAPITRNQIVKNMFNDYYTSIGLDKLGTNSDVQYTSTQSTDDEDSDNEDGEYVYQAKQIVQVHVIKRGESLGSVSSKMNCTVADLKKWNHLRSSSVQTGQRLVIKKTVQEKVWVAKSQSDDQSAESSAKPVETTSVTPEQVNFVYHTIQPGDTLAKISQRYHGISIEELKSVNGISNSRTLKPGMKLKVPVKG
jgi:D-alanyl-D-alanine carboxypeptidase (penicillin-binding protein 5/6)